MNFDVTLHDNSENFKVDFGSVTTQVPTNSVNAYTVVEKLRNGISKILRVKLYGLEGCLASDDVELRLIRCYSRKGTRSRWAFPPDEDNVWGYALLANKNMEGFTYVPVPEWMPNGGVVPTVFSVRDSLGEFLPYVDINIEDILIEALKPAEGSDWNRCSLVGLNSVMHLHPGAYMLRFDLYKNGRLFGACRSIVRAGASKQFPSNAIRPKFNEDGTVSLRYLDASRNMVLDSTYLSIIG